MQHGSILQVGDALLQLGVFAGLDVGQCAGQWADPLPTMYQTEAPPPMYTAPYQPGSAFPPPEQSISPVYQAPNGMYPPDLNPQQRRPGDEA